MVEAVIVDSGEVFVAGAPFALNTTLTLNDGTYNLTGKTVVVTVRKEADPDTTLDATLNGHAVSLVVAASGSVSASFSAADSAFMPVAAQGRADRLVPYIASFKVSTDTFYAQLLRFYMRRMIG